VALYDLKELAFDTDAEGRTVKVSPVSDDGECCHESSEAFDLMVGMLRTFPEFMESQRVFSADEGDLSREGTAGVGSKPIRVPSSKTEGGRRGNGASSSSWQTCQTGAYINSNEGTHCCV
jgi:hypothetical protein